jgi:hypothetical protein
MGEDGSRAEGTITAIPPLGRARGEIGHPLLQIWSPFDQSGPGRSTLDSDGVNSLNIKHVFRISCFTDSDGCINLAQTASASQISTTKKIINIEVHRTTEAGINIFVQISSYVLGRPVDPYSLEVFYATIPFAHFSRPLATALSATRWHARVQPPSSTTVRNGRMGRMVEWDFNYNYITLTLTLTNPTAGSNSNRISCGGLVNFLLVLCVVPRRAIHRLCYRFRCLASLFRSCNPLGFSHLLEYLLRRNDCMTRDCYSFTTFSFFTLPKN